ARTGQVEVVLFGRVPDGDLVGARLQRLHGGTGGRLERNRHLRAHLAVQLLRGGRQRADVEGALHLRRVCVALEVVGAVRERDVPGDRDVVELRGPVDSGPGRVELWS